MSKEFDYKSRKGNDKHRYTQALGPITKILCVHKIQNDIHLKHHD